MKELYASEFQTVAAETLSRNKSILDILSKLQSTEARINRSVTKAVTSCGCIKIEGNKQRVTDVSLDNIEEYNDTHVRGSICPKCREAIETEIGANLYYMASLCNTLELDIYDILLKEMKQLETLGRFSMR